MIIPDDHAAPQIGPFDDSCRSVSLPERGMTPDETLRRIFEDEVREGLGIIQSDLIDIERGRLSIREALHQLLRLAHGLKGSARVVGYDLMSQLAHAMETRLKGWTHCERVSSWEIELTLRAADLLGHLAKNPSDHELQDRAQTLIIELAEASSDDASHAGSIEIVGDHHMPVAVCSLQRLQALRAGIVGARRLTDDLRSEVDSVFSEQVASDHPDRKSLDELLQVLSKGLDRMAELSRNIDEGPPSFEVQPADAEGPRHVLVVDDSATMRQTVQARLRQEGFEVSTAADGLEAHQLLRARPYAAIVTDVDMPFLSGMKLVEACASVLPIVVMTSNPIPDDEVRALELGAAAYLAKDPDIATRVVQSILQHLSTGTSKPS